MKFKYVLFIVFTIAAAAIAGMLTTGAEPERLIVGTWKQVKWVYEGEEDFEDFDVRGATADRLNKIIGHDFFVHENETWYFSEDGTLTTQRLTGGSLIYLNYVVKGRGNILLLKDGDERLESYNITTLTDKKLVLNFDVDMRARGVAELTFERINEK